MKIIIFDGSFKTTTFINRLANGLAKVHDVYIMGFNEEIHQKNEDITYVGLGSNSSKFIFLLRSVQLRRFYLKKQFQLIVDFLKRRKRKIQQENINLAVLKNSPDILHLQWLSLLPFIEHIKTPSKTKIILSERGSQLNIKPFINSEHFLKLKSLYTKVDGFHAVSKALQTKSNLVFSSQEKIEAVVYSGLEYAHLPVKEKVAFSKKLKIISVGRNHWVKDYSTAIFAMAILKSKSIDFQYTIVGVENPEVILHLIDSLGLQNEVVLKPKIPQKEVYEKMIHSDLFLLPSIEEGIANVCIEAMFCKLLVLSTDCGGMKELITHEESGFIVPSRNPEAIAKQIAKIVNLSEKDIEHIVFKARKKVEEQHNEHKMISDMESLYTKVLNV